MWSIIFFDKSIDFFAVLQRKRLCSTSQWFYHCRADQGLVVYAQKNFQKYFFILKVEPSGSCRWSNWWNILWPSGDMNFPLHFAHICYFAYFPLHFANICYFAYFSLHFANICYFAYFPSHFSNILPLFLAVQDSSIGDLVTHSVSRSCFVSATSESTAELS